VQGVADGGGSAAEMACDLGGRIALGTGQKDLAAASGEGIGRTQALPELLLLKNVEWCNKESWFHTTLFAPSYRWKRPCLPLH
jgi:hypothetical protein